MKNKSHSSQIIIIGGGLAGLAAYRQLHQYGFNVMILEARNRTGGRIYTDSCLGIPLSCGAAWIHGIKNNPITQLAKNTHSTWKPFDYQKYIRYDHHQHLIPQKMVNQFDQEFDYFLQQAKTLAFESIHDISLAEALAKVMPIQNFTPLEQQLLQAKLAYFTGYIGENFELLSARYWNLEENWPGDNCFLTDTYEPIIRHLTENCCIQFNSIVEEIHLQQRDVKIITKDCVYYADFVVITLPLGVLKKNKVIFNPSLPEFKQKAINKLGMGLLNVTLIKFPTVFWPDDCQAFTLPIDNLSIPIFFNMKHFLGHSILIGYHGGERAKRIEHLTEAELQKLIMRDFRKNFGSNIPEIEKLITTRWSQDQFSYGSYSYLSIDASAKDYDAIAHPIADRLFFAGEATSSRFLATTHGAYLSGIREADRIRQLMKC